MGTNFYRKHIVTEEDIQKLHELVDARKFKTSWDEDENDPYNSVENLINYLSGDGIHICKMSYGWQVGFDHNWGEYYQPNRESLEKFLSEPGTVIADEYGDTYTSEEFWQMVKEHNSSEHNTWNSKIYREWERTTNGRYLEDYSYEDRAKCERMFGVKPECSDFQVDGLRFSVYSDFS